MCHREIFNHKVIMKFFYISFSIFYLSSFSNFFAISVKSSVSVFNCMMPAAVLFHDRFLGSQKLLVRVALLHLFVPLLVYVKLLGFPVIEDLPDFHEGQRGQERDGGHRRGRNRKNG